MVKITHLVTAASVSCLLFLQTKQFFSRNDFVDTNDDRKTLSIHANDSFTVRVQNGRNTKVDALPAAPDAAIKYDYAAIEETSTFNITDILLAVVTSRKSLSSRVVAIRESWGHPSNIPSNVHIRYFVGNGTEPTLDLLRFAGLENSDELVVMAEVEDDEYPPVEKNTNMFKRLRDMVYEMESSAVEIKYIMKVDDDTYVNFDGLLKFLAHRDPTEVHHYWGSPGIGSRKDRAGIKKAGLKKPFCMGGPGYVLSRATLEETANGVDVCVREADASPQRKFVWHSDVIIGMCITRQTGTGCRKSGFFRHNYKGALDKSDLKSVVTMHPFKRAGEMARQQSIFGKPQNKAMKQQKLKATSEE